MSVTNKEKNFISAVVYLHNDGAQAVRFFKALNAVLVSRHARHLASTSAISA